MLRTTNELSGYLSCNSVSKYPKFIMREPKLFPTRMICDPFLTLSFVDGGDIKDNAVTNEMARTAIARLLFLNKGIAFIL
jgi:hypothetical protein